MTTPPLFLRSGERLALAGRIGGGGEGEVFAIAGRDDLAVKIYSMLKQPAEVEERRRKVEAMVSAGLAARSELAAFPQETVFLDRRRFHGFTMRRVNGRKPLHELYSPGARKAAFPRADYRFLVRTAANVARGIGAVHETGCVIGDINHSGILVSDAALVSLIDADSFQFTAGGVRHPCRVGVPEYTPPELQGVRLHEVERTLDHDRFGLAVVLFQLLFMGRHPFSGAYAAGDMPLERAIGERRFAYTRQRQVGMRPPPFVPTLAEITPPVAAAFEAAFGTGATRPSARQWVSLLGEFEKGLKSCPRSPLHHHSPNASECPWCRMERQMGMVLFLPHGGAAGGPIPIDPGAAGFNLAAAWGAIQAVPRPGASIPEPALPQLALTPTDRAMAARGARRGRRFLGLAGLLVAIGVLVGAASIFPVWIGAAWFGLAKLLKSDAATADMRKDKAEADRMFDAALGAWRQRASDEPFVRRLAELEEARRTYSRLGDTERDKMSEYQRNRRTEQLKAYLDSFLIRRQKIKGVGDQRVAILASYGIETALDVRQASILNVPGFGPKTAAALTAWRSQLEARFVYNERPNAADQARVNAIKAETVRTAAELRRRLLAGPSALAGIKADVEARRSAPDPQLAALHERREQLAVDLAA